MYLLLVPIFLTQITALSIGGCEETTHVSKPIDSPNELIGVWYNNYYWMDDADDTGVPTCLVIDIYPAAQDSIEEYKRKCEESGVPAEDVDHIKLAVSIRGLDPEYFDRYITEVNGAYSILQSCNYKSNVQVRTVEGQVMVTDLEWKVTELFGKEVMEKEALKCFAKNVDVMKGQKGQPRCWL